MPEDNERTAAPLEGENLELRERVKQLERRATEHRHTEKLLAESNKKSRAWLECSPICTKIVDRDFNLLFMSRAGVVGLGIEDVETIYGKPYPFEFYPESFRRTMLSNLRRASETGEVITQEAPVVDVSGTELWFHSTIVPVTEDAGELEYTVVVSIDTTARNLSDRALRDSEQSFRSLGESIQDGITRYDPELKHLYHNAAAYRMLRTDEVESIGKTDREMGFDEDLCTLWEEHIGRVFATGEPSYAMFEWPIDGETHVYDWHVYPELDQTGVGSVLGIAHDVTELRREEERRQAERQLQQRQKLESLGVMAGGIAHDFNNILHAILGNADMALTQLPAGSAGRESLQEIQTAARRASGFTNKMLAYSGKGALVVAKTNLSALVKEMAQLLAVSHTKKAIVDYRFEAELPAMEGDVSQLHQVVMNLVTNASEALGEAGGHITIATGVKNATRQYLSQTYADDDLHGGRYVFLEVADTGCGMNKEARERIFEPFFTTKFTGRGLGMAAVLGIVRSHRGALDIQTEVGRGTTVKVLFPAIDEPADTTTDEPRPEQKCTKRGTILVVDDEPQVRLLMQRVLEQQGLSVVSAEDGDRAIEVFRDHKYDIACALLDLTMPRMGGEETMVELRRIREDIPVVLCSGYSEEQLEVQTENLGFAGFLKKPVSNATLIQMVSNVLTRSAEA